MSATEARCVGCGLCLPTCPTYLADRTEERSPRARLLLAKWAATAANPVDSVLASCTLCGLCAECCPYGVDLVEVLHRHRGAALLRPAGLSLNPWAEDENAIVARVVEDLKASEFNLRERLRPNLHEERVGLLWDAQMFAALRSKLPPMGHFHDGGLSRVDGPEFDGRFPGLADAIRTQVVNSVSSEEISVIVAMRNGLDMQLQELISNHNIAVKSPRECFV